MLSVTRRGQSSGGLLVAAHSGSLWCGGDEPPLCLSDDSLTNGQGINNLRALYEAT